MLNENAIKSVLKLLYRSGIKKSTIQNLYRFFIHSAPEKLLFLNPNYIAVHIGLEQWEMLELLVRGLISGLFEMQWDIRCPQCASTAEHSHTLGDIHEQSFCSSCRLHFDNYADQNISISVSLHPGLFSGMPPAVPAKPVQDDRLQAVSALSLLGVAAFREHFSTQIPDLNHSVKVRAVTVMFTDLIHSTAIYSSMGDIKAYALVKEHFDALFREIVSHSGGVIKTIGDAVLAIFQDPATAVKVSFDMKDAVRDLMKRHKLEKTSGIKTGISSGTALIVNMNDTLDLFGATINLAARIINYADRATTAVTETILENPDVNKYVNENSLSLQTISQELKGIPGKSKIFLLSRNS